jgi:hypothetical protein
MGGSGELKRLLYLDLYYTEPEETMALVLLS